MFTDADTYWQRCTTYVLCVCCLFVDPYLFTHADAYWQRAHRTGRPGRDEETGLGEPAGNQGFQGHAFHLSANHFEIIRETYCLRIVVFLFLRIGPPQQYILSSAPGIPQGEAAGAHGGGLPEAYDLYCLFVSWMYKPTRSDSYPNQ